jgi:hypothetical protein
MVYRFTVFEIYPPLDFVGLLLNSIEKTIVYNWWFKDE